MAIASCWATGVGGQMPPDACQRRAIRTAELALAACDREWIPVCRSWRLNSNHHGALQGKNKSEVPAEYGKEQLMAWRRSWDTPPPALPADAEYSQFTDPRYGVLPPEARPAPNR